MVAVAKETAGKGKSPDIDLYEITVKAKSYSCEILSGLQKHRDAPVPGPTDPGPKF